MKPADGGPIASGQPLREYVPQMNPSGSKRKKMKKGKPKKPSHTCAICNRHFQPLHSPSKGAIYSICPDCRMAQKEH